jgi:inosine/xanthosine triphosphatase
LSVVSGWRRVRVGTRNAPKLAAVRAAIGAFASPLEVVGADVGSGVPEQPVGLAEIARGARNRALAAFDAGPCDAAVGLEDGLAELPGIEDRGALNVGCAVVWDGRRDGLGLSSGFAYPPACVGPALSERRPIGDVFDAVWRRARPAEADPGTPSAISIGNIGKLSGGVLTRGEYARHAVLCALVPFLQADLYPPAPDGDDA